MTTETWYAWKEYVTIEDEEDPRLVTPWSDPSIYEFPFDFLFASIEEAHQVRAEYGAEDEDWILCRVIYDSVEEL